MGPSGREGRRVRDLSFHTALGFADGRAFVEIRRVGGESLLPGDAVLAQGEDAPLHSVTGR
jgi:hypothetical protein